MLCVSINSFNLDFENGHSGVPQDSLVGPPLFLTNITFIHCASSYFSAHHFTDDTNLLNYKHPVKRMNKEVNQYLKKNI